MSAAVTGCLLPVCVLSTRGFIFRSCTRVVRHSRSTNCSSWSVNICCQLCTLALLALASVDTRWYTVVYVFVVVVVVVFLSEMIRGLVRKFG